VDLYIHSPIRLHRVVLNYLSTGTTLPYLRVWDVGLEVAPCLCLCGRKEWMLSECGLGCIACSAVTWGVWVRKWEGGCVGWYVFIRTSNIGLRVSFCVSFNCNTFLVSLHISKPTITSHTPCSITRNEGVWHFNTNIKEIARDATQHPI
jgi:hypothetical protein